VCNDEVVHRHAIKGSRSGLTLLCGPGLSQYVTSLSCMASVIREKNDDSTQRKHSQTSSSVGNLHNEQDERNKTEAYGKSCWQGSTFTTSSPHQSRPPRQYLLRKFLHLRTTHSSLLYPLLLSGFFRLDQRGLKLE